MRILIYQSVPDGTTCGSPDVLEKRDRHGPSFRQRHGQRRANRPGIGSRIGPRSEAPALFLFHSLLSDRASFDAIVPKLSRSFRLIVPELPGFGGSKAVSGGLAAVADRMAEAVKEAAAMMRPSCSATAMAGSWRCRWRSAIPRSQLNSSSPIAGRRFPNPGAKPSATWRRRQSQGAGRDHRRRDAPAVCAGVSGAASRPDAGSPRGILENRPGSASGRLRGSLRNSTSGRSFRRSRCPCWCWSANMTRRRRRRCRAKWRLSFRTRA